MTKTPSLTATPALVSLIKSTLSLPQPSLPQDSIDESEETILKKMTSTKSRACAPMSVSEGRAILEPLVATDADVVPLSTGRAIKSLILSATATTLSKPTLLSQLDTTLSATALAFPSVDPPPTAEEKKAKARWAKRMERLRLQSEERKYRGLTSNLDTTVEDDVTTRSMTYAASVGLNMIVAPLSFGVFMYFFAGQFFRWLETGENSAEENNELNYRGNKDHVDIRRVITGVVCGVGMLFIEMLLFVIRSHEFDSAMTKKKRSNKPNPFGFVKGRDNKREFGLEEAAKDGIQGGAMVINGEGKRKVA